MLGSSRGGQALGAVILIVLAAAAVSAIYTARRNRGRNQQQQQQNRWVQRTKKFKTLAFLEQFSAEKWSR